MILSHGKNFSNKYVRKTIGHSYEGRPLELFFLGKDTARLKIFILSGQHGDEKNAKKVALHLVDSLSGNPDFYLGSTRIAVLPDANPDGASANNRKSANNIDLNRDHQLLESNENLLIHNFVNNWKPHLVIDLHNYPPRRKHLLLNNLVYKHDVFIDIPSNPSVNLNLDENEKEHFFKYIESRLGLLGFCCGRYTIITPSGRARHGTPDVVDARNFLSLRFNILTILLEGRLPTRPDGDEGKIRAFESLYQALLATISWSGLNKNQLTKGRKSIPATGDRIPIHSKYQRPSAPLFMNFANSKTNNLQTIKFEKYTPLFDVTKYVNLPCAYAVPLINTELIKVLKRHGFSYELPVKNRSEQVEKYFIQSVKHSVRKNRSPRKLGVKIKSESKVLDKFLIFPVSQDGGKTLSVFLEPESKYGLHRFDKMNLRISSGTYYSILRLRHWATTNSLQKI